MCLVPGGKFYFEAITSFSHPFDHVAPKFTDASIRDDSWPGFTPTPDIMYEFFGDAIPDTLHVFSKEQMEFYLLANGFEIERLEYFRPPIMHPKMIISGEREMLFGIVQKPHSKI